MTFLKSLTFCAAANDEKNPVLDRRNKLIARLEQQKRLAADPDYSVSIKRNRKGPDGERSVFELTRKVRPWWKHNGSGQMVLTIRNGVKPIEFEKGKAGIVIESEQKLPSVVDTLIKAIGSGELDAFLSKDEDRNPLPKSTQRKGT